MSGLAAVFAALAQVGSDAPSWQWVVGVFVSAATTIAMFWLSQLTARINRLSDTMAEHHARLSVLEATKGGHS